VSTPVRRNYFRFKILDLRFCNTLALLKSLPASLCLPPAGKKRQREEMLASPFKKGG
jgi:hypothetical protein